MRTGGAPGALLSHRTTWLPATPCIRCDNKPSQSATCPVCSAALSEWTRKEGAEQGKTPGAGLREWVQETHPPVAAARMAGAHVQHSTWLLPCSKYKFTAPRSRGLSAKGDLLHFQKNTAGVRTQTLLQHAAFSGTRGRGRREAGKRLPAADGFSSEPGSDGSAMSPFPPPFLPGDRQPYRRSGLGRRTVQSPSWERATRLVFPRHSLSSACTRETAATAERLWERRP